ncbi:hypothetical protein M0805_004816 [Coniferiporia weirii]|nr:hypothetical protein M0805_004816 [Coniferiporia weirii]
MVKTADTSSKNTQEDSQNASAVDALVELEKSGIQSSSEAQTEDAQPAIDAEIHASRPRIVYTRKQLLHLSQSSLVKPPDGMPEFKSWFGELNDQSLLATKKESETQNTNGTGRERRYRREVEDGDGTSRPPFRSALSQPSQMGNFKHQPLRASDRDRDRDTERDLRTLSDKYDRERGRGDRIGLPSHSTLLRNRDRDSAPHLASDRDAQRPLNRKRNGESKEDWRRGAEPPRAGRDEPHARREREDRDRPRSRARDGSRQRDSPPSTRRERERDDHRRDRDRDRFVDADEDGRRWRDDGKREERMSVRRDKDRLDREKGRDRSREPNDHDREARDGWSVADDRGQKRGLRDRRHDDGREKEDRREREKEKEPAWMETYVPPSTSSSGILGGKGAEGEVDSIQAWKKDMKEREMKAKGLTAEPAVSAAADVSLLETPESKQPKVSASAPEAQLDEIQLFKLMMKQEEKKRSANGEATVTPDQRSTGGGSQAMDSEMPGLMRIREGRTIVPPVNMVQRGETPVANSAELAQISVDPLLSKSNSSTKLSVPGASVISSQSTVSLLNGTHSISNATTPPILMRSDSNGLRLPPLRASESNHVAQMAAKDANPPEASFDPPRQSRLLAFGAQSTKVPAQPTPQSASAAVQMSRLQQLDPLWPGQRRPSASPVFPQHSASQQSGLEKAGIQQHILAGQYDFNVIETIPRRTALEATGAHSLTFENAARSGMLTDSSKEYNGGDMARSSSIPLTGAPDRAAFISQSDALHHLSDLRRNPTPPTAGLGTTSPISPFDNQLGGGQSSYSSGKGSRMAKHFEKMRDPHSQTMNINRVNNPGMGSNGMLPGRQEHQAFGNPLGGAESRNIQDLLTMLSNSAQAQRGHQLHGLNQGLGPHQPSQSLHMGPSGSIVRHDSLSDPDEGRFAPDGLVPGLRPVPAPAHRSRDMNNGNLYANQLDDSIAFNTRLGPPQRGGMEQLFPGPVPSQFNGQGPSGGRGGLGFQQQAMRGGPSPINNFNPVQAPHQQRLPPGLANLGGRPPHEPSQFLGGGVGAGNFGVPPQLHASLQHSNNGQPFNQFQNPGLGGVVGNQGLLRGQPGIGQLGNPLGNGLNGADFRGGPGMPPQNQMLGLGNPNVGQAMRGGPNFNAQLHGQNQLPPSMNLRQQHSMQPQLMPQMLPPQLQQHGIPGGQHNPNDLMALLMGGAHRE